MKKLVILSGAGMSAESGILTFRDMGGLWDKYRIEEVASPIAWNNNPQLVLDFYNIRRKQLLEVEPNSAHYDLVKLEKYFDVEIVTQNVDDLHERAGSSKVLHLHGELRKIRSVNNEELVTKLEGWELKLGDLANDGAQFRPHIVWFGEPVPMINNAVEIVKTADILIIIGTSLAVYPAAGLIHDAPSNCKVYYIDPNADSMNLPNVVSIAMKASLGTKELVQNLISKEV